MSPLASIRFPALLAFVVIACFGPGVSAQDACPDMPYPGPESIIPYLSRGTTTCQSDSYVRTGIDYKADFLTLVGGICDIFIYDAATNSCVLSGTVYRGIGITLIQDPLAGGWTAVTPNPNTFPQQLDTRAVGTSTPDNPTYRFNYEGERTLRFRSSIDVTSCNLQPNVVQALTTVKAVKCVPEWERTSQNQIWHSDQSTIYVRVPPAMNARMRQAISNAVQRWNTALDAYGTGVGPRYEDYESDVVCGGRIASIRELDLSTSPKSVQRASSHRT
jgi:hypothetical protein